MPPSHFALRFLQLAQAKPYLRTDRSLFALAVLLMLLLPLPSGEPEERAIAVWNCSATRIPA